jgi:hypothetical protein
MPLVAAAGEQGNAFWEIQLLNFHFSVHLERQAEKEYRRRKHVFFSSAIFQLWLLTFDFQKHWGWGK